MKNPALSDKYWENESCAQIPENQKKRSLNIMNILLCLIIPHDMRMLFVFLLTSDIRVFIGNSDDVLTVFLDFFLTKYFCKRDVKNC